jgi:hypothetical protein
VNVDAFLGRLERVHKTERGWTAVCPAHDDTTASLSVGEGDDGRVLVRCFAGCTAAKITAALGLHIRDLFPDKSEIVYLMPRRPATREERLAQANQRLRRQVRQLEVKDERMLLVITHASLALAALLHHDHELVLEALWRNANTELDRRAAAAADEYAEAEGHA